MKRNCRRSPVCSTFINLICSDVYLLLQNKCLARLRLISNLARHKCSRRLDSTTYNSPWLNYVQVYWVLWQSHRRYLVLCSTRQVWFMKYFVQCRFVTFHHKAFFQLAATGHVWQMKALADPHETSFQKPSAARMLTQCWRDTFYALTFLDFKHFMFRCSKILFKEVCITWVWGLAAVESGSPAFQFV